MKWTWADVQALPTEVYDDVIAWLAEADNDGEPVIDMDALDGG